MWQELDRYPALSPIREDSWAIETENRQSRFFSGFVDFFTGSGLTGAAAACQPKKDRQSNAFLAQ